MTTIKNVCVFVLLAAFGLAQAASSNVSRDAAQIAARVPWGYKILAQKYGDLNQDAWRNDALVVLEKISGARDEPRPLLLFARSRDNRLVFRVRNDQVVMTASDGGVLGDPFRGISIKNGYFSLEHEGGSSDRWTLVVTFRYYPKANRWFLWKQGGDHHSSIDPAQKVTTSVKTQKDFGWVALEDYRRLWGKFW